MNSPLPNIKYFSVKSELRKAIVLDPELERIIQLVGYPPPRRVEPGFSTLAKVINSQMLSTQSAAAIWRRVEDECDGDVSEKNILSVSNTKLRACGLSARKQEYIVSLAEMVNSKILNLDQMPGYSDEELIKSLVAVRGIGLWSAQIYAMFALGRRDFYPAKDLALQVAIEKYLKLDSRPTHKEVEEFSIRWSPHRSAVALLMWRYYGSTTLAE